MTFLNIIKIRYIVALFLSVSVLIFVCLRDTVSASDNVPALDVGCQNVEIVFARGSSQSTGGREFKKIDETVVKQIRDNGWTTNLYELGSGSHGGYIYDADGVGSATQIIDAKLGIGSGTYRTSVYQGKEELLSYMQQRTLKCPDSRYVLTGYSQGAHVIGDALEDFSYSMRDKIVYIAYFGEPRLWLPEGRGLWPAACRGSEVSPWRKGNPSCTVSGGILSGRDPYIPGDLRYKIGSWCDKQDYICTGKYHKFYKNAHSEYSNNNAEIDQASREIARRIGIKGGGPILPSFTPSASRNSLVEATDAVEGEVTLVAQQDDYYMQPGDTAYFDLSQSYDKYGNPLATFKWDFNNDGIIDGFDDVTKYTYNEPYDGFVRVVGVAGYGESSEVLLKMYVGNTPLADRVPKQLSGLSIEQKSVQTDSRTVLLRWAAQDDANGFAVYSGDTLLTNLTHEQTFAEIENVILGEASFSIKALNEYGSSPVSTVSIAKYETPVVPPVTPSNPPPKPQTLACKALKALKPYMHPLAYSILFKALKC